jgi:CheY-like chemotaxis protein
VPRVLIVDDEPDILLLLRLNLELAGYDTALAADGDEALQRLRKDTFDVVLLDLQMPVLDGWAVLSALKDHDHSPPVVVLTAFANADGFRERAFGLGAAGFVSKPPDFNAIPGELEAAMTRRRNGATS